MVMRKLLIVPVLLAFVSLGVHSVQKQSQLNSNLDIQLDQKEIRIKTLQQEMLELDQELDKAKGSSEQDKQKIEKLKNEKEQLEKELQAKLERKEQEKLASQRLNQASNRATLTQTVEASGSCGDNPYKQYIYQKESGCRTTAVNPIGCRGIGQACPGIKLPCGDDFACQDAWFSNYAIQRYGSWENAYNFWLKNHWW